MNHRVRGGALAVPILDEDPPQTLLPNEELAASVERAVRRETGCGIRNLRVVVNRDGVLLKGWCSTYYCKQLAQHAAMGVSGQDHVTNSIEVS